LPAGIREHFAALAQRVPDGFRLEYRPALLGQGKVHFRQTAHQIDEWRECRLIANLSAAPPDNAWQSATRCPDELALESEPDNRGRFAPLPAELTREKSYSVFGRQLKEHLYRSERLNLCQCELLDACSQRDETTDAFRARLAPLAAARFSPEREKLQGRYAGKLAAAEAALAKHQARLRTQRWQFFARLGNILWVAAEMVLRAFGRGRRGRPRSAEAAFRQATTEHGQQSTAQLDVDKALADKQRLEKELQEQERSLEARYDPASLAIEPLELPPQKTDIDVQPVALVWLPWRSDAAGKADPIY
jgi:hypothetical protein